MNTFTQSSRLDFSKVVDNVGVVITQVVLPILFSIALVCFLWGVFSFIKNAGDEGKRGEAKQKIFWGIIGLAVMVSLWGLVSIITGTFGVGLILPQIDPRTLR